MYIFGSNIKKWKKISTAAISGVLECSPKGIPEITGVIYKHARGTGIGENSEAPKKIFLKVAKEQKKKTIGFKKCENY